MSSSFDQNFADFAPSDKEVADVMAQDEVLLPEFFRLPSADQIRLQLIASKVAQSGEADPPSV